MSQKSLKLGIIGGGQLGMFIAKSAIKQKVIPYIYSNTHDSPARKYAHKIIYGSFDDKKKLSEFFNEVDIITYEFENISTQTLKTIRVEKKIYPPLNALSIAQDRKKEKTFFKKNNINHAETFYINSNVDLKKYKNKFKFPSIIKTARFGYDGKGQKIINSIHELKKSWESFHKVPCVVEEKINLKKELSIVIGRNKLGELNYFPSFRNLHKNHILHKTYSPSGVNKKTEDELVEIAKTISNKLNYVGVLTIEFFVDHNNEIYVNEIAPRVHNSGHITQNTFNINQFDLHVMMITGVQVSKITRKNKGIMLNLIGNDITKINSLINKPSFRNFLKKKRYLYGKKDIKAGRKMGHINFYDNK